MQWHHCLWGGRTAWNRNVGGWSDPESPRYLWHHHVAQGVSGRKCRNDLPRSQSQLYQHRMPEGTNSKRSNSREDTTEETQAKKLRGERGDLRRLQVKHGAIRAFLKD